MNMLVRAVVDMIEPPAENYAWVITEDHLAEPGEKSDAGVTGPSQAPDELIQRVEAGEGHVFYLYDDDGEKYYTGRLLTTGDMSEDRYCVAPLEDFGEGWAGCTEVRWDGHSEWNVG